MKRRVLRVGRSSLAVSLPKEYVAINHVDSGQEIDVTFQGSTLTVQCEEQKSPRREISIQDLSLKTQKKLVLDKIIGALFRQGLDTFSLGLPDKESMEIVRDILKKGKNNLYEEPRMERSDIITIRSSIQHFDKSALNDMIQVTIKNLYQSFEDLVNHLKKGTFSEDFAKEIVDRDRKINDQTDICKRIINKNIRNHTSTSIYLFVDRLEKIGDEIKYLAEISSVNEELAKKHLTEFTELKSFFYLLYGANSSFTPKKIASFYNAYNEIKPVLSGCKDKEFYHHFRSIVSLIKDGYSALMVANL